MGRFRYRLVIRMATKDENDGYKTRPVWGKYNIYILSSWIQLSLKFNKPRADTAAESDYLKDHHLEENMTKSEELFARAEEIMKQANEARQRELVAVVAEIKTKMANYGLTATDLGFAGSGRKRQATKPAPAFRGPHGELWSGKGRQPQWLKAAVDAGASKEQFRI
jgi:DNA-binding protein H-NS